MKCLEEILGEKQINAPCDDCKKYDPFMAFQECNGDMMAIDWERVNEKYETEVKR